MSKKIGIYAGTFDPIHLGHLSFAKQAVHHCDLDKLYFMVEPRPRRKQGVKALEHRQAMLRLALRDNEKFGDVVLEQSRFTVSETLPKLKERFKGSTLYMLVGEDVMMHLTNWPHIGELLNAVHFVIGTRSRSPKELTHYIERLQKTRGLAFSYTIFSAEHTHLSSAYIRAKLRKGSAVDGDLPPSVIDYIRSNGLYTSLVSE